MELLVIRSSLEDALSAWGTDVDLPEASPLVAAALELAAVLDLGDTADRDAALWREYRMLLKDLREVVRGGTDSGFADFLEDLRSTPMGDTAGSE